MAGETDLPAGRFAQLRLRAVVEKDDFGLIDYVGLHSTDIHILSDILGPHNVAVYVSTYLNYFVIGVAWKAMLAQLPRKITTLRAEKCALVLLVMAMGVARGKKLTIQQVLDPRKNACVPPVSPILATGSLS